MPARGLLSSCATPDTSCPIADIFSDWMSCSCSIFWSVTSNEAEHFLVLLRRRVGDRDGADFAVLAVELRVEQPGLAGQCLLEVAERFWQVVVGEHGREPLPDQLLALVA